MTLTIGILFIILFIILLSVVFCNDGRTSSERRIDEIAGWEQDQH